jgi:hypothetical protein
MCWRILERESGVADSSPACNEEGGRDVKERINWKKMRTIGGMAIVISRL